MKIVLVSKCSLDIEQYVEFEVQVLISPQRASLAHVGSQIIPCHAYSISVVFSCTMCKFNWLSFKVNKYLKQ